MKFGWALAITVALLAAWPAAAQSAVRIEADAQDSPIVIVGWLGEQNTLVANLRLTAHGGDVTAFTVLPSDLTRDGGDEIIGRQDVRVAGDTELKAETPKDFQVSISNVAVPGRYQGRLEILLPDQARADALVVNIDLTVKARPALTALAGADQVRLELVNCSLDCPLARLLLPASALLDSWQLPFDNKTLSDVKVTDAQMVVHGEGTGYQLAPAELALPSAPVTLPANKITELNLALTRSRLPPDHYIGSIYLTLEGQDARLTVPIDISVRAGPALPVLLILAGIVLGRLAKYMQARGEPLAGGLQSVNRLAVGLSQADPEDRALLEPMVQAARQMVYQEHLDAAEAEVTAIGHRLEVLQGLRAVETMLADKKQNPKVAELLAKVKEARQQVGLKKDDDAAASLKDIQAGLVKLKGSIMADGKPDPDIAQAAARADSASVTLDKIPRDSGAAARPDEPRVWRWVKRGLYWLAGLSIEVRAEATLWLVRPLLYLALLAGLLVLGLTALYVDKGQTFGASPLADYTGLVLWGLTADIAGRTLTSLKGSSG